MVMLAPYSSTLLARSLSALLVTSTRVATMATTHMIMTTNSAVRAGWQRTFLSAIREMRMGRLDPAG